MNDSTRRFRLATIMALLIALALGSFWLLEVLRRAATDFTPTAPRTEPDFYVEKFSYVKLTKDGAVQYHFAGDKLTHNPQDDSFDIEQPVINSVGNTDNTRSPMIMRSQRAHVNSDNSKVEMIGNVQLDRPASENAEYLHAKSEYLQVLPDDDIMRTDKQVDITLGRSHLSGKGMIADNARREFRLTSNVHGTYQPPAR